MSGQLGGGYVMVPILPSPGSNSPLFCPPPHLNHLPATLSHLLPSSQAQSYLLWPAQGLDLHACRLAHVICWHKCACDKFVTLGASTGTTAPAQISVWIGLSLIVFTLGATTFLFHVFFFFTKNIQEYFVLNSLQSTGFVI